MQSVKAVILAAGLGTRMKSDVPKVLHQVGSSTILGRVISSLKKAGVSDITVVVGHKADAVRKNFEKENVKFVIQKELLGSGDALKSARVAIKGFKGSILVTCGDTPLITEQTYKNVLKSREINKAACVVLTSNLEDPYAYGRIVRAKSGDVLRIVEEKDATDAEKRIKEINVGTYCFDGGELDKYIDEIKLNEKKKEFYLTDIIEIMVGKGKKVCRELCGAEEAMGINSRKDLAAVNKAMNKRAAERLMESGVTIIDPDNTYIEEGAEIGKDTVIYPCTVIDKDTKIGCGCKIGPFARIRSGSKIGDDVEVGNFVEINRTEIGEHTKVKHHAYLGDAIVGKNVNVGAGTITANYDGKTKNRTIVKDGAFLGVGVTLIAPVEIGKNAKVGAGSVVTKNKNVKDGETVVGVPARPYKKD